MNWILKIVMAKPMQFTMVKAVPFIFGVAFLATNVENNGESAMTTIPQNSMKLRNQNFELNDTIKGIIKQQIPDNNKAENAVFFSPKVLEKYPPITQAKLPIPIIINDQNETCSS